MYTEQQALERAVNAGRMSPCSKSQRGVVVWNRELFDILAIGYNHPPLPFFCDGSEACRASCREVCVHAEQHALLNAKQGVRGLDMLHVKVVDGVAVPSGPPSCPRCSLLILEAGIKTMWLLHADGLRGCSAEEFHELTMRYRKLPVIR